MFPSVIKEKGRPAGRPFCVSVFLVLFQELERLLVCDDVGQPALQRVADLQQRRQLRAVDVPGAALVLLEHLHLDPGQIGELRLRQAGSFAELLQPLAFVGHFDRDVHVVPPA